MAPTGFSAAGGSPAGASAAFGSAIVGMAWGYARGAGQRARVGLRASRGRVDRGDLAVVARVMPNAEFRNWDALGRAGEVREGAHETSRGRVRVAHTHPRLRWSSLSRPGAVPARSAMRARLGFREDTWLLVGSLFRSTQSTPLQSARRTTWLMRTKTRAR